VKLVANGRELFNGNITIARLWEQVFDLGGIDLGQELALDIVSDTYSPLGKVEGDGKVSDDPRTLGVQVWGVQLLPAMEVGQPMAPAPPARRVTPAVEPPGLRGVAPGLQDLFRPRGFVPAGEVPDDGPSDPALAVWRGHPAGVSCGAVSPDGWTLVSGSWDGTVKVWDVLEGGARKTFPRLAPNVSALALRPDGKAFATAASDQRVNVWELETGKPILTLAGPGGQVTALAYSPDGLLLAAAAGPRSQPGELKLWDAATGKEHVAVAPFPRRLWSLAFAPDGKRLVVGGGEGTAHLVDAGTGMVLATSGYPAYIHRVALAPDGKRLAVAYGDIGQVRLHDLDSGQTLADFQNPGNRHTMSLQFGPDGKRLLCCCGDGSVVEWDVGGNPPAVRFVLKMHTGQLWFGLLFPDGRRVATGGQDRTVRLRRLEGDGKDVPGGPAPPKKETRPGVSRN
jgi:WD40 repeat protein